MLFDEKDLSVFDNPDSRSYFKEILQSYYSQNYRATSPKYKSAVCRISLSGISQKKLEFCV